MMRSKAIVMALLVLAFGAQARLVSQEEAVKAAGAWSGVRAQVAAVHRTDAGSRFYAVALPAGGTVFLSGDTERRPVIAFTPDAADFSVIDRASPLWALLKRDQDGASAINAAKATAGGAASASVSAAVADAERQWAELLSRDVPEGPVRAISPATTHVTFLSDVRAGPLVESEWDQSTADGKRCYNYYTPVLSDGTHAVCGCVATAMSQVMRYHRFPAKPQVVTRTCYVQASTAKTRAEATKTLTTAGEAYAWDNMPLVPDDGLTEAQCKAIGRLTSDAGISVCMSYDTIAKGGSGSFLFNVAKALSGTFGYANACYYRSDDGVTASERAMRNALLANFDAGYPVLMGISGDGGHAIVGDGYGYKDDKLYVHLNMGWSGEKDFWYNLPDIDSGNYHFTAFDDVVYDIFPTADEGTSILSGRVIDDDGKGLEGVTVNVLPQGGGDPVASCSTSGCGVFGVRLTPGTYAVEVVSADGTMVETRDAVSVPADSQATKDYSGWIVKGSWSVDYTDIMTAMSVGNLKLTEAIVLSKPTVRIGAMQYATLDKALVAARECVPPVEVTVIDATELRKSVDIDFPCVLTTEGGDPDLMAVMRTADAKLNILAGGCVAVENVTFTGSSATLFEVAAGGTVEIGAGVSFGIPDTVAAIATADADGFVLADELKEPFAIRCQDARTVNSVFGHATCDFALAATQAAKIINLDDPDGEIAGVAVEGGAAPYELAWGLVPVPLEDAAAYYVTASDVTKTNCFRRLDRLFEIFAAEESAAEVTIVKSGTLSRKIELKGDLAIVSRTGAVISNLATSAGFAVAAGTKLTVAGICFDGKNGGDSLFVVDGGELALEGGTEIRNFTGNANKTSAAIRVINGGKLTVGSDDGAVTFENCRNVGSQCMGGAIYVLGAEVTLKNEVSITDCSSRGTGGGLYVGKNTSVSLSGRLVVSGNISGDKGTPSDIYCASGSDGIVVTGPVEIGSEVGVRYVTSGWNAAGFAFADMAEGFDDPGLIFDSAQAFFCDDTAKALKSAPNADYTAFVWVEDKGGVEPVDPEVAHVHIAGTADGYYGSLEDALAILDGKGGTIEIVRDTTIVSNLDVVGAVTLKSAEGGPFTVSRAEQCKFTVEANGSLTIEDLALSGEGAVGQLFLVEGGDLILGPGAVVRDVDCGEVRNDSAIKVRAGGRFVMKDGALIADCRNPYTTGYSQNGRGGAVTADEGSVVRLEGGTIENCSANLGGGAFIGNQSVIEIGGTATVATNGDAEGRPGNVYVPEYSELLLIAPLEGAVGVTQGKSADQNVFGRPADEFVGSDKALADSAHKFTNDRNGDVGFAVRSADGQTLLVWSDALDVNGNYTNKDGKLYRPLVGGEVVPTQLPIALELTYNGYEQVGLASGHGFTVTGDTGKDAGNYTATVTLKDGFAWDDGETAATREIPWTIAKATVTVTADDKVKTVGEADPELTYTVSGLQGGDRAEDVLAGALSRKEGEEVGFYDIGQGSLDLVEKDGNYELAFVGARLEIIDQPVPPPPPPPGPIPVPVPQPIYITSLTQGADGTWTIVVNPVAKFCKYTLYASDDLESWNPVGEPVISDVDADLTFTRSETDPKKFWKVVGEDGEKPAE